ncbi:AraC family transcriptional regulator [Leucobacter sp. wl10]|uniref:helix-turn-helix domain-containing protein n=1 Tax=Leucobacter sp. wl10 TaxID=2304677 RepID=UPI000E5A75DB|nr:AraC family transcriptional regulator [Leucobacter sp. wl10]RGE19037.1 AraC family transcriptional regulator [Leucobacter sp. wl10]
MAAVQYRRFSPDQRLVETVEHYWAVVAPAQAEQVRAVLIPNGRATVQFCLDQPGYRLCLGSSVPEVNADVFLPVTAEPYVLVQDGPSHYVGVQFTPWGAAEVWPGVPAAPVPIDSLSLDRPSASALRDDPATALDSWLLAAMQGAQAPHGKDLVMTAVRLIDQNVGHLTVSSVAAQLAVSRPTLYRAFNRWIGISPKEYLSVRRYASFTSALQERKPGDSAAMLAAATGYADQAHAAREFRRHTGMTATAFRDRLDGIAELMFRDLSGA